MLKRFRNTEGFVENVELSWSTIYFKIVLYKFWKKCPALKNATLSSHYFRNNFRIIKRVYKSNKKLFTKKKNRTNGFIVIWLWLCNGFIIFLVLSWDFFFLHVTSFALRLFLFSWDFFFFRETFSFFMRLFLSSQNFLFPRETFYFPCQNVCPESYFTESENFWSTIKEWFGRLCSLCLVSKTFL